MNFSGKTVVLGVTGGIAAYKGQPTAQEGHTDSCHYDRTCV